MNCPPALEEAKKAQPSLVSGNLADSKEVARAKGYGYSMLADLAQKAAFVEASAPADATGPLQQATEELFRQTLADAHTRGEVAVILPKWLGSRNRKHGGVFFAAKMVGHENKGSVTECRADLDSGQSITVLVPAAAAERLAESSRPMAVRGVGRRPAGRAGQWLYGQCAASDLGEQAHSAGIVTRRLVSFFDAPLAAEAASP